jgi:diacylglycerol kinase family enzyme
MDEHQARPRRAIVVHSPYSGKSDQLPAAITSLQQHGIEIAAVSIKNLDGLPPQGTRWVENGFDTAIAAGGDGLVGGVATHVVESGLPMGILPLGTANDIARSLSIPQELPAAIETITDGKIAEIDIGVAQPAEQAPHSANPQAGGHSFATISTHQRSFFVHALTTGLNVQFARLATNVATRQRFGRLTYPFAALEVLRNHQALEMEMTFEGLVVMKPAADQAGATTPVISADTVEFRCRALQATVINAPVFGGAWQLSIPGANLQDRLLDIVIIEDIDLEDLGASIASFFNQQTAPAAGPASWQTSFPQFREAELIALPGIHHVRARGVIIKTNADPQDVTLDGEVRGRTPIDTHMAEQRLKVLVPPGTP